MAILSLPAQLAALYQPHPPALWASFGVVWFTWVMQGIAVAALVRDQRRRALTSTAAPRVSDQTT